MQRKHLAGKASLFYASGMQHAALEIETVTLVDGDTPPQLTKFQSMHSREPVRDGKRGEDATEIPTRSLRS